MGGWRFQLPWKVTNAVELPLKTIESGAVWAGNVSRGARNSELQVASVNVEFGFRAN
jgi:hypothetical protein